MYRKDRKNEFYTELAKKEKYPARSVYKLQEIDKKYEIFKKGNKVLDLGCAPGSWLLYISEKIGNQGIVIGLDTEDIKIPQKNNIIFIKESILNINKCDLKYKFDSVVSDLSPKTSGISFLDSGKSLELAEKSFEIAKSFLLFNGNFICKIFDNELSNVFFKKIKENFSFSDRFRPRAVFKKSREFYIIGKGFKNNYNNLNQNEN